MNPKRSKRNKDEKEKYLHYSVGYRETGICNKNITHTLEIDKLDVKRIISL